MKKIVGIILAVVVLLGGIGAFAFSRMKPQHQASNVKFDSNTSQKKDGTLEEQDVESDDESSDVEKEKFDNEITVETEDQELSLETTITADAQRAVKAGDTKKELWAFESDKEVTDQKVINNLRVKLQKFNDDLKEEGIELVRDKHMAGDADFLNVIKMNLDIGYAIDVDTVVVHETPTKDVVQFTVKFNRRRATHFMIGYYHTKAGHLLIRGFDA